MEYISTRNTQKTFSFKEVFLKGLAPDGGLFIPKKIYKYSSKELKELRSFTYNKLAANIISKFCGNEFGENEIQDLKQEIARMREREDRVDELRAWKEKVDEVVSPTQMGTLVKEVEDLKLFKTKAITIFAVVQFAMGAIMFAMKFFEV